jgi:hypothetical protein
LQGGNSQGSAGNSRGGARGSRGGGSGGGSSGGSSSHGAGRRAGGGGDRRGRGHANIHVTSSAHGGYDARMWRPRFLLNRNCRSTLLTEVKPRSTWVLTKIISPTNPNDPIDQVDTHVWSTRGQSHGQTLPKP